MKKSSFLALALAPVILGAPMAATAQSVATDPVGFVKTDLPSGYTAVGLNMLKPATFSAKVESKSGNDITLSGEPTLAAGASYYVEVADGVLEGDRIDVASATAATVTLNLAAAHNTLDTNAIEVGSRVIIREHHTMGDITDILGAANLHTGANYPDSSDQILTSEGGGFVLHAIFDGAWYDAGGNPADDKILPPGSGFLFLTNPDAPGRDLLLTVLGEVRNNDFIRPLATGYQLVSVGFPVDTSPGALGMTPAFFTATNDQPEDADQILPFQGGFQLNYLFSDGEWYDAAGNPVTTANLFQAGSSVVMFRHTADADFRISNQVQ